MDRLTSVTMSIYARRSSVQQSKGLGPGSLPRSEAKSIQTSYATQKRSVEDHAKLHLIGEDPPVTLHFSSSGGHHKMLSHQRLVLYSTEQYYCSQRTSGSGPGRNNLAI